VSSLLSNSSRCVCPPLCRIAIKMGKLACKLFIVKTSLLWRYTKASTCHAALVTWELASCELVIWVQANDATHLLCRVVETRNRGLPLLVMLLLEHGN
jgi:hypothetical protein